MSIVNVNAKSKSYNVHIEKGIISRAGSIAKDVIGVCKAAVITDDIVDSLHADKLISSLEKEGYDVCKFVFKNGESSKNAGTYIEILNFLAKNRLTRKDAVFALGGGVAGDMAGFAAATYQRGIKLVQLPTTLLSSVDSSVGGKTAIDLDAGKNLVGSFYQPDVVICDTALLKTLPEDIFLDGCAEVIKYSEICDEELFRILSDKKSDITDDIITRCVEIKRDVVAKDENDLGLRQLLNFGHTFGHAVERCSDFSLSHGKAVAIGMAMMAKASVKKGWCSKEDAEKLITLIKDFGLPTECSYSYDAVAGVMLSDKKRMGNNITVAALKKTGLSELEKLSTDEALELLKMAF